MLALFGQLVEQAFIGLCFFGLAQLILALTALIRLLPFSLRFLRASLRYFLVLSFRLYRLVLTRLAPIAGEYLGMDILVGWGLVTATIGLSLVLGLLALALLRIPINIWSVGLLAFHGLAVGLLWDDLEPTGIRIGEKLQ